LHTQN